MAQGCEPSSVGPGAVSGPEGYLPLEGLEARADALAAAFRAARPFPHLHLEALLHPEVARRAAAAFPRPGGKAWTWYRHLNEDKAGLARAEAFPPLLREVVAALHHPRFLALLERIAGVEGLHADPDLEGGGLHWTGPGGFLNVHADFLDHPQRPGWRRRLNLILYLNPGWDPAWGGALELWDRWVRQRVATIPPLLNHAVLFETSATSFHGHPEPLVCPPDRGRCSLALYYYVAGRPPGRLRGTDYRARPQDGWRRWLIRADTHAVHVWTGIKARTGLDDRWAGALLRRLGWVADRRRRSGDAPLATPAAAGYSVDGGGSMGIGKFLQDKIDRHRGPGGLVRAVATKPFRVLGLMEDPAEARVRDDAARVEAYQAATANVPAEPDEDGYRAVCAATLVQEGRPGTFELEPGLSVAVYRHQGRLYAINNACNHEDGPLGESDVEEGGIITCPYHNWRYRLEDGECLTTPNRNVACYHVRERDGFIWIGPPSREGSRERGGEHDDGMAMVE